MKKITVGVLFSLVILIFWSGEAVAQCAMCKAIVESNSSSGGSMVDGLNGGILYLMAVPYIMLTLLGVLFFRKSLAAKFRKEQ
ncbi:MAG: hypothetical protein H6585_12870 [Flavobacteriales bacterium]|nr:hypothetical protein [Flavobacteriales bacterium]MCB9449224.1 hypothetical protein [Flavobacteriales bacterium]